MKRFLSLLLSLALLIAPLAQNTRADGISGSITPQLGGGIGVGFDGGLGGAGGSFTFNARVAQIGDSIANATTSYSSGLWINAFTDLVDWGNLLSGSRLFKPQGANKGVGGETSTQIAARFTTDMAPFAPQIIFANAGINDADGVTSATVIANIASMKAQAIAMGAKLAYLPPYQWSGESVAQATRRPLVIAGANALVDANFKVVDTSTFNYLTDCYVEIQGAGTGSQIHPNILGAQKLATSLSTIFNGWANAGSPLLTASDPLNKITNGFMTGTGGTLTAATPVATGSVADSWTVDASSSGGATVVASKVARTAGGFWQQVAISGTYTGNGKSVVVTGGNDIAGLAAGDWIEVTADLEIDSGSVFVDGINAFVIAFSSDFALNSQASMFSNNVANGNGFQNVPQYKGVYRIMPLSMAGAAPVHFTVSFSAFLRQGGSASAVAATFRVGSVAIRKLTALVPGIMSAPSLAAGDSSIAVTRAADPQTNGGAISSYDLRTSTDQVNWTVVSMTTNPQTVSGLTNGTPYFVQTRANNSAGNGPWSASATATPALVAANIILNGTMASSTVWDKLFGGWSISAGLMRLAAVGAFNDSGQTVAPTAGKFYEITYTISGYSAGSIVSRFEGTTTSLATTRSSNGTFVERIIANTGNNRFSFQTPSGPATLNIGAVTVIGPYNTSTVGGAFLLKRDLNPASNDNDPMWLEKAA